MSPHLVGAILPLMRINSQLIIQEKDKSPAEDVAEPLSTDAGGLHIGLDLLFVLQAFDHLASAIEEDGGIANDAQEEAQLVAHLLGEDPVELCAGEVAKGLHIRV